MTKRSRGATNRSRRSTSFACARPVRVPRLAGKRLFFRGGRSVSGSKIFLSPKNVHRPNSLQKCLWRPTGPRKPPFRPIGAWPAPNTYSDATAESGSPSFDSVGRVGRSERRDERCDGRTVASSLDRSRFRTRVEVRSIRGARRISVRTAYRRIALCLTLLETACSLGRPRRSPGRKSF